MWFSQFGEDRYLNNFFPNEYKGFCVDVGASNGTSGSNTYFFEKKGWNCICIEPNNKYVEECKKYRKIVVNCCCGSEDNKTVEFTIFNLTGDNESAISSLVPDERLIKSHKHMIRDIKKTLVSVRTLNSILEELKAPLNIDFISIDTENTELDVLKGLDLTKYNIKYLVIENNFDEPYIEEYLKSFNYKKIHRLAVNDFYEKIL